MHVDDWFLQEFQDITSVASNHSDRVEMLNKFSLLHGRIISKDNSGKRTDVQIAAMRLFEYTEEKDNNNNSNHFRVSNLTGDSGVLTISNEFEHHLTDHGFYNAGVSAKLETIGSLEAKYNYNNERKESSDNVSTIKKIIAFCHYPRGEISINNTCLKYTKQFLDEFDKMIEEANKIINNKNDNSNDNDENVNVYNEKCVSDIVNKFESKFGHFFIETCEIGGTIRSIANCLSDKKEDLQKEESEHLAKLNANIYDLVF